MGVSLAVFDEPVFLLDHRQLVRGLREGCPFTVAEQGCDRGSSVHFIRRCPCVGVNSGLQVLQESVFLYCKITSLGERTLSWVGRGVG